MRYFILAILLIIQLITNAQPDINKICKIDEGRLVFLLDTRWSTADKLEISNIFDLDSLLLDQAFKEIPIIINDSIEWQVKRISKRIIELSKKLSITSSEEIDTYSNINVNLYTGNLKDLQIDNSVTFGVNKFTLETVFSYSDSIAVFFLPGHKNAEKVYLSGTFNEWSTMQNPMHLCDSGWVIKLKLPPNRYSYKYIVDGKWTSDSFNELKKRNEHGTYNSVLYCYNYFFKLNGYKDAKKVFVIGSFNKRNKKDLKMKPTATGWELPVFLKEGTYSYKFMVNNKRITDPDNLLTRDDGSGSKNSILEIGKKHEFYLKGFTNADKIILTGNFNNWNTNELNMKKTTEGWKFSYVLAAGIYEYKYIVDGRWMADSTNRYTIGSDEYVNSVLVVKPNYTFVLENYQDAEKVFVTGSFNNWNTEGYSMGKKNGKWIFPVYLKRGKHLYKFITDGKWIIDPDNSLWEDNRYGTDNSVLWIK